jgi:site-specific DNA recombinase
MSSTENPIPLRLVGYCRRSQERTNGFGLASQEDAIRRWATYQRAEVVAVVHDDDTTGVVEPTARAGLSRALDMLRAGEADALVVPKLDRLARGIVQFADVLKLSQAEGWRLVVLDPTLDMGTAIGRAVAGVLVGFADVEREAFRDRMQAGRRAKIARGGYGGGQRLHRRYGFQLVPDEDGWAYEPVADEQDVIARIREMRGAGKTLTAISRSLEAARTVSPSGARSW